MKRVILVAIAFAAASTGAYAANIAGTVKSISKAHDTVTLENGRTFHLPEGIETESLSVGERIKIAYTVEHSGRREVRSVSTQ